MGARLYLLKLRHVLRGLDTLVKETDEHGLKAVEVGAVVHPLVVHDEVHQEQSILLWLELAVDYVRTPLEVVRDLEDGVTGVKHHLGEVHQ